MILYSGSRLDIATWVSGIGACVDAGGEEVVLVEIFHPPSTGRVVRVGGGRRLMHRRTDASIRGESLLRL